MRIFLPLLLTSLLLPAVQAAEPVVLPAAETLAAELRARDDALFHIMFERCEPDALRALVSDDLEFYHDKDGLTRGADAFVDGYARSCAERRKPDAWRSRRMLVPGTLKIDPVPGYGAIVTGEHTFHERQGEGPQQLVGRARFAIVWQRVADDWRMTRVLSYDHGPAGDGGAPAK